VLPWHFMPLEDSESFKRELKTWLFRKAYGEKRFNSMGSGKRSISVTYYYYYYYYSFCREAPGFVSSQ
jgi:hypothetical protein